MERRHKEAREDRKEDQERESRFRKEDQERELMFRKEDLMLRREDQVSALRREIRELKSQNPFPHPFNKNSWMEIDELEAQVLTRQKANLSAELVLASQELKLLASEDLPSVWEEYKVRITKLQASISRMNWANKNDVRTAMEEIAGLRTEISFCAEVA